jgi:hypothetical protein
MADEPTEDSAGDLPLYRSTRVGQLSAVGSDEEEYQESAQHSHDHGGSHRAPDDLPPRGAPHRFLQSLPPDFPVESPLSR